MDVYYTVVVACVVPYNLFLHHKCEFSLVSRSHMTYYTTPIGSRTTNQIPRFVLCYFLCYLDYDIDKKYHYCT